MHARDDIKNSDGLAAPATAAVPAASSIDALVLAAGRLARVGGWALEASTLQVHWTDEVFRLHDLEPGPVPDLARAIEYYEPSARSRLKLALEAGLREGTPIDLEFAMDTAKGRRIWMRVQGEAVREGGRIVRLIGAVQDITGRKQAELALQESEDRYRGIFDSAADAIVLVSLEGIVREANSSACAIYGYSHEEFVGKHASGFVHPDHAGKFADALDAIRAGRLYTAESVDLRKGGVPFPVEARISPFLHKGEPVMLCLLRDISERRRQEARMREALVVFNASAQAIMTTDPSGTITSVNPAFQAITGYAPEEALGRKPSILSSGHHDKAHFQAMCEALINQGVWEGEVRNRRKDGRHYVQWQSVTAVRDDDGRIVEFVALFSDITERKQQEEAVWRQANFDALTGLANRRLFLDLLERAMAQARRSRTRLGVLFLDLDDFKSINDTRGHDIGDLLLVEVAARLRSCVRERDTVARLGGDEFTIVVHDVTDVADLRAIAEKAIGVLREPFTLAGRLHHVTGSAGITVYPDDAESLQALLRHADIAMYKSKQAGRNRFHFYAAQMQADALQRLRLESELREAIAMHAFVLHFQPIVDADSGELIGAEALLRWQHPQRGLLLPAEFMAVAEESGLVVQIGEWVLRAAVRHWRGWQLAGQPPLRLSINMALAQLRGSALDDTVRTALAEAGLQPAHLLLEISESSLGEGGAVVERGWRALQSTGVSCALDRFGTGLSSLAGLKHAKVDLVKIDRSLLQDCPQDRDHAHLVEAIVHMVHSLGLRVAACGVETEAQRDFLRDLGCDQLQGHLIGEPMTAAAFATLARQRRLRPPLDGASLEQDRLLAALRADELDVDEWLRRLLAEHSTELAGYLEDRGWTSRGLDLRGAVHAHLQCRRCLSDLVLERTPSANTQLPCAGTGQPCVRRRWLVPMEHRHDPRFADLVRAVAHFDRLADEIVADCRQGYRESARRSLVSLKFRTASRDLLLALVEGFKDAGHTAPAPLDD